MIQYEVLKDLADIKTNNEKTLLHELVDMFSQQTPERFNQIESAIKQHNKDQISRAAHTLKASCSYLGANNMVSLCSELEKWSRTEHTQNMTEAQIYLSALEDSFEESIDELNQYLQTVVH